MRAIHKLIIAGTLMLVAGQVAARGPSGGNDNGYVQNAAPGQGGQFRDRWQAMPQERRDAVRDRLLQQWQSMPPEERQQHRKEWLKRLQERQQHDHDDDGYGRGYGNRY